MYEQRWQKHFSFGQAKYRADVILNAGLEKDWNGGMDYGMDYGILKKNTTFFIEIHDSAIAMYLYFAF